MGLYERLTTQEERQRLFTLAFRIRRGGETSAEREEMDRLIDRVDKLFLQEGADPFWIVSADRRRTEPVGKAELFFSLCVEMRFWQRKTQLLSGLIGGFKPMESELKIDVILNATKDYYVRNGRSPFWE